MSSVRDQACISGHCRRARQAVLRDRLQRNKVPMCPGLPGVHGRTSGIPRMQRQPCPSPSVWLGCAVPPAQPLQPLAHPDPRCAPPQRLRVLRGALAPQPMGMDLCPAVNLQRRTDAMARSSRTPQAGHCLSPPCSPPGTGQRRRRRGRALTAAEVALPAARGTLPGPTWEASTQSTATLTVSDSKPIPRFSSHFWLNWEVPFCCCGLNKCSSKNLFLCQSFQSSRGKSARPSTAARQSGHLRVGCSSSAESRELPGSVRRQPIAMLCLLRSAA